MNVCVMDSPELKELYNSVKDTGESYESIKNLVNVWQLRKFNRNKNFDFTELPTKQDIENLLKERNVPNIDSVFVQEYSQEMKNILAKAPRDSQGRLLAPNGKPSNLTERQYAQVRTKAFKEWFGDWENDPANASKVVDENGEPLVVYHGQVSQLNEFHPNTPTRFDKTNANGLKKMFYATPSISHAKQFSLDDNILLKQEIQKYLVEADATLKEVSDLFNKTEEEIEYILNTSNTTGKIYSVFLNIKNPIEINAKNKALYQLDKEEINAINNSEGAIVTNIFESLNPKYLEGLSFGDDILSNPFTTDYIVSNPNQIKSATDNIGTFSTTNDDIRYSSVTELPSIPAFAERLPVAQQAKFGSLVTSAEISTSCQ